MKLKIKTNLVSGIIFILIGIAILVLIPGQIKIPAHLTTGPSPQIIPRLAAVGMLICSAILIIQSLVFKKEKIIEIDFKYEKTTFLIIASVLLFGILMITAGYLIAVWVVIPLMLFLMKERKIPAYIVCLAIGTGIYFLFNNVFYIFLPKIGG